MRTKAFFFSIFECEDNFNVKQHLSWSFHQEIRIFRLYVGLIENKMGWAIKLCVKYNEVERFIPYVSRI